MTTNTAELRTKQVNRTTHLFFNLANKTFGYLLFSSKLGDTYVFTLAKVVYSGAASFMVVETEIWSTTMWVADVENFLLEIVDILVNAELQADELNRPLSLARAYGGYLNNEPVPLPLPLRFH